MTESANPFRDAQRLRSRVESLVGEIHRVSHELSSSTPPDVASASDHYEATRHLNEHRQKTSGLESAIGAAQKDLRRHVEELERIAVELDRRAAGYRSDAGGYSSAGAEARSLGGEGAAREMGSAAGTANALASERAGEANRVRAWIGKARQALSITASAATAGPLGGLERKIGAQQGGATASYEGNWRATDYSLGKILGTPRRSPRGGSAYGDPSPGYATLKSAFPGYRRGHYPVDGRPSDPYGLLGMGWEL